MEIVKGLKKTKNYMGHTVLWLHYSADPAKDPDTQDGKKWYEVATPNLGGATSLRWRAEMEMDFSAGSGELVFPEMHEKAHKIVIPPFPIPDTFLLYGALDWGTRHPLSFHVYAESPDKKFYSIWEFYATNTDIQTFAKMLHKECPYYHKLQWIAMDPRAFSSVQQSKNGLTTLGEMFSDEEMVGEYTVDKLIPAHSCEDRSAINRIRNLWAFEDPKLKIFSSCVFQIRELQNLLYPPADGKMNARETIVDKNNHSFDDLKYFLESHPFASQVSQKPVFGTVAYIDEITALANRNAEKNGTSLQDEFNHLWGIDL